MTTLNISLPDSLTNFINEQLVQGGYSNPSDYIQSLIMAAQKQAEQEKLEQLLLAGLDSGEPAEVTEQWWSEKQHQLFRK